MITFIGIILNIVVGLIVGWAMGKVQNDTGRSNKKTFGLSLVIWLGWAITYSLAITYLRSIGVR